MLQDLLHSKLENEYMSPEPSADDLFFHFSDAMVLIHRNSDNTLVLPEIKSVSVSESSNKTESKLKFLFRFNCKNCYLLCDDDSYANEYYSYENVRNLRQMESKDICFAVMTAWHLNLWYNANKFCGRCGEKTIHDDIERMVKCPECGNIIYPRISPAVIIAVTDGDRILLSKYAGRNYNRYALLAGYTEIGETLERTVEREVMEEVGLKVKNIRYYKSQPWGVDGNILMGFFCDLDGDDLPVIDENELSFAGWYERDNIPCEDDGISLTREMIRIFSEGMEPQ